MFLRVYLGFSQHSDNDTMYGILMKNNSVRILDAYEIVAYSSFHLNRI